MWNEPMPVWRNAQKQHQCQGDGCNKVIAKGERYLDRALRDPPHSHLRYCQECAEPVVARAIEYHMASNGDGVARVIPRNDFPDRYQKRISSAEWKTLKRKVIEQRGNRCERCEKESASLELHHLHYESLGSERPEDVELLCAECHTEAHESPLLIWLKRFVETGEPQLREAARQLIRNLEAAKAPRSEPQDEGLIVGPDGEARWGKLDPDMIYAVYPDGRYLPLPSLKWEGKS